MTTAAPPSLAADIANATDELLDRHMRSTQLAGHMSDGGIFPAPVPTAAPTAAGEERDPFPLHMPQQDTIMFQRAHTDLKCKCAVPSLRLLGMFEHQVEGQPWSGDYTLRQLQQHGNKQDIFLQHAFEPILIPRYEGRLTQEEEVEKIDHVLRQHSEKLKLNKARFEENVKNHQMGDVPPQEAAAGGGGGEPPSNAPLEGTPVDPLPIQAEVRGQKMAVISVVHDPDLTAHEPVITIYGVFETESDAKHYIEATLSKHVVDQDLFVHPLYEWIQLCRTTMEDDHIPRKYRDPTLHAIMKKKRQQTSDIETYYAKCKEGEVTPNIVEITPDNEDAGASESKGSEDTHEEEESDEAA